MCVSRSQKPMQSAKLLPPPPGALGAVSLGLPGDRARPPDRAGGVPPLENCVDCWEGSGAIPGACGAGAAKAPGVEVDGAGSVWAAGALSIDDDELVLGLVTAVPPVRPPAAPPPPPLDW